MADYNIERIRFLVVDDNAPMRALLNAVLRSLGVKMIDDAPDGRIAFERLKEKEADIVICDWNMSPIDGVEFTRMVRHAPDSPNPFAPIIMLSGHAEVARVVEARDAGVNEFLAKPVSAAKLFARIKAIIEHPRPFVRTASYFGPCRRRRDDPRYQGPDRRAAGGGGVSLVVPRRVDEDDAEEDGARERV